MPPFDFPNTPSVGDLFQDSTSGAVYKWNGYAWIGGVTGIGLQSVKETRYLTAGSFTHIRDPKSNGFADIHVMGAMGGRLVSPAWVSGQTVFAACGGSGAITIKWKYALGPNCAVVVGAPSGTAQAGASSFDGTITANGGAIGQSNTVASAGSSSANGGATVAASSSGDENYYGHAGAPCPIISGNGVYMLGNVNFMRGIERWSASASASTTATLAAALGDPGAVVVVEYLNP